MKIMVSWMTHDELEGARTRQYFIDRNGMKDTKQFTYRNPFGINRRYIHQVDDQNDCRYSQNSLQRTWATKLWPDQNLSWYFSVLEVNTYLATVHLQNYVVVQTNMDFCRYLAIKCLENTFGVELCDDGQPNITSKLPIYVPCEKIIVKHHGGIWVLMMYC